MHFDNAYENFVFELSVLVLFLAYDKDYPASEGDRGRSFCSECAQMEAVGSQASKESRYGCTSLEEVRRGRYDGELLSRVILAVC